MEQVLELLKNKRILIIGGAVLGVVVLTVILLIVLLPSPADEPYLSNDPPETKQAEASTAPEKTEFAPEPNLYDAQDFAYDGPYMTCLAGDAALGIDVSNHQGQIDWQQVKDAGVEFVFIRVGGRGYGQAGILYVDELCQQYYAGAKAAGLKVGAYFFSQAINEQEARYEAYFALDQVKNWELDLPIAFDWEYISDSARTANMDADTLTACVLEFCRVIESEGYDAMLYTNPSYAGVGLDLEKLADIKIWLAMHSNEMTYPHRITAWQYTATGSVPGIETDVDINLYFEPLSA